MFIDFASRYPDMCEALTGLAAAAMLLFILWFILTGKAFEK